MSDQLLQVDYTLEPPDFQVALFLSTQFSSPFLPFHLLINNILPFIKGDLHYIARLTMQYLAQPVQCLYRNVLVVPDIAHGMAADIIVVDQTVSCHSAFFHCPPKRIIIVHGTLPPIYWSFFIMAFDSQNEHIVKNERIVYSEYIKN